MFTINGNAQDTIHYFNKTYLGDSVSMLSPAAIAIEDGYLSFGIYNVSGVDAIFLMKTNLAGTYQWIKNIDVLASNEVLETPTWGQQLIKTSDGNVAFTYTKRVMGTGTLRDIYLVKMKTDGIIIWNQRQVGYGEEQALQVIETHDGGFALFGFQYYENDTTKYYLVKTDTSGVEQWHQSYVLDEHSVGFSIKQTADHGYIMGGYGYSNITGYDTYIVKTDSVGGVLWTTNFGEAYNDCGGTVNLLANNQYLITACNYLDNNFDRYMRFTKLNNLGEIIWDSTYTNALGYATPQAPLIFLPDSSFVALVFYQATNNPSNLLVRFDLQGNIIWQHEYTSNPEQQVYLKDLRPTPDGGFIMAGYEYTSTPQKGYLVKVDSLGRSCSWVGCDSVGYVYPVGIASPLPPPKEGVKEGGLWVYPNPAQDYLTISNLSTQQNTTFVLYDVLGREQLQQNLSSPSFGEATISTQNLFSGVYLYHILNPQNQTLQYDKLIVLH